MSFVSPVDLYHAVKMSWSSESISTPFDATNPCRNQCAVTALAVQKHFGGEIVKTETKGGTHFYNLIDGRYWDLAADQFDEPIPYDNTRSSALEVYEHATSAHLATLLCNIDANS
jgi:hypothetical protein